MDSMLISCRHVLLTYLFRPRFWIAGGIYLFMEYAMSRALNEGGNVWPTVPAGACAVVCSFLALHARRQFGGPAAHVIPGFAGPHLLVGIAISLLLWIAIPGTAAWWGGVPLLPVISLHAVGGVFFALVILWPRAVVLLATLPIGILWLASARDYLLNEWIEEFMRGNRPGALWLPIAMAVGLMPLAARALSRMSDRDKFVSDDFNLDELPREGSGGKWEQWMLAGRDAVAGYRLAHGRQGAGWNVQRWRIPVSTGWGQWLVIAATVWGLSGLASVIGASLKVPRPEYGVLMLVMSCAVLMLAPFGTWNSRRAALTWEFARPVTRPQFVKQMALALAADIASWLCLLSIILIVGLVACLRDANIWKHPGHFRDLLFNSLCMLWGYGAVLYGIGLIVLRYRYWILLMIGGLVLWSMTFWPILILLLNIVRSIPAMSRSRTAQPVLPDSISGVLFLLVMAMCGWAMARWACHRWVRSDFS